MYRRTALPLVALLMPAVLGMLLAAQTSLACTDKVAVSMPGMDMASMPGMDMASMSAPGGGTVMVCPIVLALIVASAVLGAAAVAMLWRDPHRALTQRALVHALAQLPPVRTASTLVLSGSGAVAAMLWLERSGPPALSICGMLIGLLLLCALSATVFTIVAGRIALAFGRRLLLAIVAAIAAFASPAAPREQRFAFTLAVGHAIPLLAAGRGLRAPPLHVG